MTRRTQAILACLIVAVLAGCGATPLDKVANAERTYAATAHAARIAVDADLFPADGLDALAKANTEANATLADANARVRSNEQLDANFWAERALSAALRFAEFYDEAKGANDARD